MKIAVLQDDFPPYSSGGAGTVAYTVARGFQKNGHEVTVITTVRDKEKEGVTQIDGLTVHAIATAYDLRLNAYVGLWNVPVVRKVEKILRTVKPDVVHAHNVHGYLSYRSLAVAKNLGARVVLTCHDVMAFNYQKLTDFIHPEDLSVPTLFEYRVSPWRQLLTNRFRYNPLRNVIIRRILKKSVDQVVAVSDALKQALNDNGIRNVQTIHNGIDVKEWEEPLPHTANFKRNHGIGDAAILFGGRLSGIKGAVKILEAFALVHRSVPEAQLLIVGQKDAYAEKMLAYARTLGVEEHLLVTGWLSGHELHQAYHAASVVVVPSLCFDSFPTMNLEAMACRKPVVATCFGGSREVITSGVEGYIINPFDVSRMAETLTELTVDKTKNATFGTAGYKKVEKEFSLAQQVKEYETLYSVDTWKKRN